jgi:putative hydrolase of HD superfamily
VGFLSLEFRRAEAPESRFANAVDRAMSVLPIPAISGGNWRENGVSYDRMVARVTPQI